MKKLLLLVFTVSSMFLIGCTPEVGSDGWCADMKEKPTGDWSANDVGEFAQNCVFTQEVDENAWCEEMKRKPKGDWSANDASDYTKNCIFK